jgi:uncharacterized protein (TIGR02996 family)
MLSLLRAAKEDLDDGSRRLILADWLEENGDEIDREKAALLREQAASPLSWAPPIDWYPAIESMRFRIAGTLEGLLAVHAPARTLATARGEELAATEEWAWVADLTVSPCGPGGVRKLVEAGILSGIPALTFSDAALGADGPKALVRLEDDGVLRHLSLGTCCIDQAGLRHLLRAPFLPGLESLDLSRNRLGPTCIGELASRPFLRLASLSLARNRLREGPTQLAAAPWAPGLRELDISGGHVNQAGLIGLLSSDLSSLRSLRLDYNEIGDAEMAALAHSPLMARLETLTLFGCRVTARGLQAIGDAPKVPRLRHLSLGGIGADGDEQARLIAGSPWASTLEGLAFAHECITAAGAAALAGSEYLGRLRKLFVNINALPAAAVASLRERFKEVS